jgi:hypothetical protein
MLACFRAKVAARLFIALSRDEYLFSDLFIWHDAGPRRLGFCRWEKDAG